MAEQQPPLQLELWRLTPPALLDQFFVQPDQALAWEPHTIYGPWADWPDNYQWRLYDRHGREHGRWSAASVSDGLVYDPTTRGDA